MASAYKDRFIECTDEALSIRFYYFPAGTKRIPYGNIRAVHRFDMTALRGKGRIWGSGTLRYWASLDPGRPKKSVGITLDIGKFVRPFITPDDPDAVLAIMKQHTNLEPSSDNDGRYPF